MTTNYTNTFISVAPDCPLGHGEVPPQRGATVSSAQRQYELLSAAPYSLTSDDLLFAVYAERQGLAEGDLPAAREAFFAKSQACLRASPLGKRYGWGLHHDAESRVALVALGSEEYERLSTDESLQQVAAMRSRRA
ncbi:hypothetical protein JT358_09375 [Micrococcales bacterium 31B]|nr:hypothetical protein [Micrococcales bacterium 31B]